MKFVKTMTIHCPNPECNLKMSLRDTVVADPNITTKCPKCKKIFSAYALFYQKENLASEKVQNPKGWLILQDGISEKSLELFEGENFVGREPQQSGNSLVIGSEDPFMSRNHFSIKVVEQSGVTKFLLKDCHAANGTFVGEPPRQMEAGGTVEIKNLEVILAGKTKFTFKTKQNPNPDRTVVVTPNGIG